MSPACPRLVLVALVAGVLLPTSATAQSVGPGNAASGKVITERWCSSCHIEDPKTAEKVLPEIPAFVEIAQRRDWTPEQLTAVIAAPHEPMPKLGLTRDQIADIVAYFASLDP